MSSKSLRRKITLLLLGAACAATWAEAAGPRIASSPPTKAYASRGVEVLQQAWNLLSLLANKTGCRIDPNGL
ncbi:MAG TPA: hypothetical protein VMW27_12815, partial [Thermoanaerobaculia bacterium]|nr:hypothetical protein [Thermoanaerobaculia bacterium]